MERPAVATPLTPDEVAAAIVPGYVLAFGGPPDRERAELLTALVYLENANGAAIIDHNWGNISVFASDSVDYWRPPWFDLEAVQARPDSDPKKARYLQLNAQMQAHKAPSAFRAFDTDEEGIAFWLHAIPKQMLDAASTGDPFAFAAAYFESGYCPDQACKESGPSFKRLQTQIRAKNYFAALEPSKKKPSLPAAQAPSLPSPPSASPPPSSGQPFGSVQERGASMTRELIVFAASCELEDMTLLVQAKNTAGVHARILTYWQSVLKAHPTELAECPPQWCGAFALWCLHQAGIAADASWDFGPPNYGFLWRLRMLEAHETPQAGDIAYLDKPYQHHAIVVTAEGDTVRTIDGNQGAATPITTHAAPRSHWTAFYSIASLLELEPPKEAA